MLSGCALLPGERSHTPTGHVVIASGGTQGVYHMYARPLARELHSRAPDLDVDIVEQLAREVPLRLVPLGEPALAMQDRFGAVYDQAAIPEGAYGLPDQVDTIAVPNFIVCRNDTDSNTCPICR